jgi:hypothetical protein
MNKFEQLRQLFGQDRENVLDDDSDLDGRNRRRGGYEPDPARRADAYPLRGSVQ